MQVSFLNKIKQSPRRTGQIFYEPLVHFGYNFAAVPKNSSCCAAQCPEERNKKKIESVSAQASKY